MMNTLPHTLYTSVSGPNGCSSVTSAISSATAATCSGVMALTLSWVGSDHEHLRRAAAHPGGRARDARRVQGQGRAGRQRGLAVWPDAAVLRPGTAAGAL